MGLLFNNGVAGGNSRKSSPSTVGKRENPNPELLLEDTFTQAVNQTEFNVLY